MGWRRPRDWERPSRGILGVTFFKLVREGKGKGGPGTGNDLPEAAQSGRAALESQDLLAAQWASHD